MSSESAALFQPIKIGNITLAHRVVLAPLTRYRADKAHVHGDLAVKYYAQRASTPGTLLISEATFIAARAGGYDNVPGIWSDAQIAAWKRITDAVHAKGSHMFLQMWALGRAADDAQLAAEDPTLPYVSASDLQMTGTPNPPRPLSIPEIEEYVQLYVQAAKNAVFGAGFDGVEIHSANGYLLDQFLQDVSNKRTDAYGGSITRRARFTLDVVDAVVAAVGAERTSIRLSPWGDFQDMRMDDPVPTFSYVVQQLVERHPNLAYIHVVEPRAAGSEDRKVLDGESNDFIRELWSPRPLISAGGYTRETALAVAEEKGDLVAFGRSFIPNPDLPLRLRKNIPLTVTNRDLYYANESPEGYADWPFAEETAVAA